MGLSEIVFFVVLPLAIVAIVLEGRRQRRKHGPGSGRGASLTRAGLMEIQNLLEPERKVEVLRDQERKQDLLVEVRDDAEPLKGARPAPPGSPRRGRTSKTA